MPTNFDKLVLDNGLVILGQPMENLASVAFNFSIPCGQRYIPTGKAGAANILSDWLLKGTQHKSGKELITALDSLGIHHSCSGGTSFLTLSAALEASNLSKVLPLYSEMIFEPGFDADQFEFSKESAIQELTGLDDDPRQLVMLKLKENFYPDPLGQSPLGKLEDLKTLTAQQTKDIYFDKLDLSNSIFSIAGKYDFDDLTRQFKELFSCKTQGQTPEITPQQKYHNYTHQHNDGAQVHIGLMCPTVTIDSPEYYNAKIAVAILSGGMSSRLFTEVREKRGLCYAVGANYNTVKGYAGIGCYMGTTSEKAQETYDVTLEQFQNLAKGITQQELDIAKTGIKSSLIMSNESSLARASALTNDYHLLGELRTLEQIKQSIENVKISSVVEFLEANPLKDFTVFSIGPSEIKV